MNDDFRDDLKLLMNDDLKLNKQNEAWLFSFSIE
jgi:hypothetical protein